MKLEENKITEIIRDEYDFVKIPRSILNVGTGTNLLSFAECDTPARMAMFNNHHGQSVSISRPGRRKTTNLLERDWGNYTLGYRTRYETEIIEVVPRFKRVADIRTPAESPYSVVITEESIPNGSYNVRQMSYFTTNKLLQNHPAIGINLQRNPMVEIKPGAYIPEDVNVMQPRSVDQYGNYNWGREVVLVYSTDPRGAEDGFVISRSLAKAFGVTTMSEVIAEWGRKTVPLNTYGYITDQSNRKLMTAYEIVCGDFTCTTTGRIVREYRNIKGEVRNKEGEIVITEEQYKAGLKVVYRPFPGVGEKIRPDRLITAVREIDEATAPVELTESALMRLDHLWDKKIVYGEANSSVKDIEVIQGDVKATEATLCGMSDFTEFYYEQNLDFYRGILNAMKKYTRHYRNDAQRAQAQVPISYKLGALLRDAKAIVPEERPRTQDRVDFVYKGSKFDHWRVKLTMVNETPARVGYKPSDCHGGKGVIIEIREDEDMPITDDGRRADLIMDWRSVIKRMNIGQFYEHQLNAYADYQVVNIRKMVEAGDWDGAWQSMLLFYKCTSTGTYEALTTDPYYSGRQGQHAHIQSILTGSLEDGKYASSKGVIYNYRQIGDPINPAQMIRNLKANFELNKQHITFRGGNSGNMVRSKVKFVVSSKYMEMLEKIPEYLMAVSCSKLQVHGLPGVINKEDKRSYQVKRQPIRFVDETSGRLYSSTIGGEALAELFDITTNPQANKAQTRSFLTAEQPTNIYRTVDREQIPLGSARSISIYRNGLESLGAKVSYERCKY